MNIRNPKTLNDFPKFEVATVRRGETSPAGYTEFELHGQFDRVIDGIDAQWFWLLIGQENCLSASVKTLDKEAKTAVLTLSLIHISCITPPRLCSAPHAQKRRRSVWRSARRPVKGGCETWC